MTNSPDHETPVTHDDLHADDDVLNFALRAAAMLTRNGAAAVNATNSLLTVAKVGGLKDVTANVTTDQVSLSYVSPSTETPVTRLQTVDGATFNIAALAAVERSVERVVTGDISPREGSKELRAIDTRPSLPRRLGTILGWFCMGSGFAWLLGGAAVVCLAAGLTTVIIEYLGKNLARTDLPSIYSHVIGGVVAVGAAYLTSSWLHVPRPALIITASLVVRLAGVASLGAAHDLITGWFVTATARIMGAIMDTAGLVAGVLIGLMGLRHLGGSLPLEQDMSATTTIWQAALAAFLVSGGMALSSAAALRHVPVLAVVGSGGAALATWLGSVGWTPVGAAAVTAVALGVTSVVVARPFKVSTLSALTVSLVPLLPGMAIYEGFLAIALNPAGATQHFTTAAGTAFAIGTGAVFGQYLIWHVLWGARTAQYRHQARLMDEDDLNSGEFKAQSLATPDFRRPFVKS